MWYFKRAIGGLRKAQLRLASRANEPGSARLRRLKRAVLGPEILIYQYYFIGDERARTTGINYFILRTLPEPAILELTLGLPL